MTEIRPFPKNFNLEAVMKSVFKNVTCIFIFCFLVKNFVFKNWRFQQIDNSGR